MRSAHPIIRTLFYVALAGFVGSILFSVAGTLLLTMAPGRAAEAIGWIYARTGVGLMGLVQGPTWVYMALMPVLTFLLYLPVLGWARSALFFLWASGVGAAMELLGTITGFPFGPYEYTQLLGAKIAGHVPWFIPPSWYAMALLSYDLARRFRLPAWGTIGATALLMVLWDVALDPAMTAGAHSGWAFWVYDGGGVYFGMPLVNWAGWLLTAGIIAFGFEKLFGGLDHEAEWAPMLWAINVLFPIFILFAYGAAFAGVLGVLALVILLALLRRSGSPLLPRREPVPTPA